MDIDRLRNSSLLNNTLSLATLQRQSTYILDVDIRKGEKITGAFGKKLYKAKWINKKDSPIVLLEMNGKTASEEALLYITLHHPHIIETFGLVAPTVHMKNSNSILLLQEYAEDGDLGNMLLSRYFIPSQKVLLEIFIQVADAMIFLSKHNIIHGDLACRNVVVIKSDPENPKRNLVKLIDFGLTRDNSKLSDDKIDIPIRYVAQEILLSKGRSGYSEKSEIYSFAVLMWEGYSFGKIPYECINDDQEVSQRKLKGERLKQPENCDSNVWKVMSVCWDEKPSNRPNFQLIHTQLKNIQNTGPTSPLS
jgi:serine/threonine protein kinase